jgi:hypothetical protein
LVHAPVGPEAAPSAAERVEVESDALGSAVWRLAGDPAALRRGWRGPRATSPSSGAPMSSCSMRFGEEFAIEVLAQLPLLRRLDRCFQRMTWRHKAAWYATVVVLAGTLGWLRGASQDDREEPE